MHSALTQKLDRSLGWWVALALGCVGSRLATTIAYIEDPDSLRFALSVTQGFDVAALQPHFPGYPVFWVVAKGLYLLIGRFSIAFSLIGGAATVILIWAVLRLGSVPLRSAKGAALAGLVFFNPLLWLMGNRYMPDLLGAAVALAGVVFLLSGLVERDGRAALVGMALAGLLGGLRLSYLPLVFLPVAGILLRGPRRAWSLAAGTLGVLVWLVPMVLDTGLPTLIEVARQQTGGHFTEFGGTVQTEPDLLRRLGRLVESCWAGGLGAWWPGRHPLTALVGGGVLAAGVASARAGGHGRRGRRFWLIVACGVAYTCWIFFFQNVIHKSRHVLPLLPLLFLPLAHGGAALWRGGRVRRVLIVAFAGAYAAVTLVLVTQHRAPSAIAQVRAFVEAQREGPGAGRVRVASIPLVNDYLRAQQVQARFFSVEDSADVRRIRQPGPGAGRTLVIGTYPALLPKPPARIRTFYHNPYVNRMWPEVKVRVYESVYEDSWVR